MIRHGAPPQDPHIVMAVAADADQFGLTEAAKKWGINIRTVSRYRRMVRTCPDLAKQIQIKNQAHLGCWDEERMALLKAAAAKLVQLVSMCDTDHIHALAGVLKICGELDIVHKQLALDAQSTQPVSATPSPAGLWRIQLPETTPTDP